MPSRRPPAGPICSAVLRARQTARRSRSALIRRQKATGPSPATINTSPARLPPDSRVRPQSGHPDYDPTARNIDQYVHASALPGERPHLAADRASSASAFLRVAAAGWLGAKARYGWRSAGRSSVRPRSNARQGLGRAARFLEKTARIRGQHNSNLRFGHPVLAGVRQHFVVDMQVMPLGKERRTSGPSAS